MASLAAGMPVSPTPTAFRRRLGYKHLSSALTSLAGGMSISPTPFAILGFEGEISKHVGELELFFTMRTTNDSIGGIVRGFHALEFREYSNMEL